MIHPYALYEVTRPARATVARCCTDEPRSFRARGERPSSTIRRARKLGLSVPASLRVLRRSLRLPVGSHDGSSQLRVVTSRGRHVGHIRDVAIGLGTGRAVYAVSTVSADDEGSVVFVADDVLRPDPRRGVAVLDEHRLTPETREALLAS